MFKFLIEKYVSCYGIRTWPSQTNRRYSPCELSGESTTVRQEFLKHYAIRKGRPTAKYRLNMFIKLNQNFLRIGSIAPVPIKREKTKRADAGIKEVRKQKLDNIWPVFRSTVTRYGL